MSQLIMCSKVLFDCTESMTLQKEQGQTNNKTTLQNMENNSFVNNSRKSYFHGKICYINFSNFKQLCKKCCKVRLLSKIMT